MLNSGVPLHIGVLGPASPAPVTPPGIPGPMLVFSPDSSRAIDFTSYGGFSDTSAQGKVTWEGGEADQEVVLVEGGRRLQLMFNGPQTLLEAVGWLTNDACLFGLIQQDEERHRFYPELMLFNFGDSLFTNFRTPGDFPLDLLRPQAAYNIGHRLTQHNHRLP
jgi:triacylglycerol esterase/lipase EstA (alpha/beta hydrolase family)